MQREGGEEELQEAGTARLLHNPVQCDPLEVKQANLHGQQF